MTSEDPRVVARAAKLRELNDRHGVAYRRATALRDAARERVFATGAYFDEVTAREEAITHEGGPELVALEAEASALEREILRVGSLPLSDFG